MYCRNNETSYSDVQGDRKDSVRYEYPTTVVQPNQPTVTYETVSLHEENVSETATSNRVYSEVCNPPHDDPQLKHNPAYWSSKTTDQS